MLLQVPAGVQDTVHQAVAAAAQTMQQPVAEISDSYSSKIGRASCRERV